jgi:hypothetical protein
VKEGQVLTSNGAGALPTWQDATGGGGGADTALSNLASVAINTSLLPGTSDGAALGSTLKQFSDLFLAEGGVINWDNGDATLTQTNNDITFAGISTFGVGTSTAVTLGTIELGAASDTTLARSSAGVVTIEGVNIVTTSSSDVLTNKTLTAPKIADLGYIADANGNEILVLDTHAIIHRAYHALPDFTGPEGQPTGALYGLSSMLLRIFSDLKPDYIAAAYDLPKPTVRFCGDDFELGIRFIVRSRSILVYLEGNSDCCRRETLSYFLWPLK